MSDELEKSTGVTNPLVLLQAMIEKGVDPSALKQMMDLQERWEANQAKKAFSLAMSACQSALPVIVKNAKNTEKDINYATLDAMQALATPVITAHGFSLSFSQDEKPCEDGRHHMLLDIDHKSGHSKRLHGFYRLDGFGPKGNPVMAPVQADVSTHTYAQKDMLRQAFFVQVSGLDKDGEAGKGGCIGPEQIGEINDLIKECEEAKDPINLPRFLKWLGVESLEELPQKDFTKAIHELNRVRRRPKKNGGQA